MTKKKIIKMGGGLGNQMFQYAFGKALEKQQGCEVLYDISFFEEIKKTQIPGTNLNINDITVRPYELNLFNIDVNLADKELVNRFCSEEIEEKNPFSFDRALLTSEKIIFKGYFQHEDYLKNIKDEIKKDFTFPEISEDDRINKNLVKKIKECENSVFIHIRRGDYLGGNGEENSNIIQPEYYEKASEYIAQRVRNPYFFIFGENCEDFIETKLNLKYPYCYVGNNNSEHAESWKDMFLMQQCKHAIIANSTFSWWAAWLSDYEGKITIAPIPWLNKGDGIVCRSWVKIKRTYEMKKDNPITIFLKNMKYLSKYNLENMNISFADIDESIKNMTYEAAIKAKMIQFPIVMDCWSTLEELVNSNKSIIRFGDGEFAIMQGEGIPFQSYSLSLSQALKNIFYNDDKNLLTGAGYAYFYPDKPDYHDFCRDFFKDWKFRVYKKCSKFFNFSKIYYSTFISQVYPTYKTYDFDKHFSLFRSIWQDKNIILITGDRVLNNIEYNVLDNCLSIKAIYGPTVNAYSQYHVILEKILEKASKKDLLLFALGPAGKVLAYDLYKRGYRVIDIGHTIKDYDYYKRNVIMTKEEIINFFKPD